MVEKVNAFGLRRLWFWPRQVLELLDSFFQVQKSFALRWDLRFWRLRHAFLLHRFTFGALFSLAVTCQRLLIVNRHLLQLLYQLKSPLTSLRPMPRTDRLTSQYPALIYLYVLHRGRHRHYRWLYRRKLLD